MIATIIHIYVKSENIEDFMLETIKNHEASVREPGNLRFDVLQDADDPSKFVLYEAYISETAAALHKETNHYKVWQEAVTPWMLKPRERFKHNVIRL